MAVRVQLPPRAHYNQLIRKVRMAGFFTFRKNPNGYLWDSFMYSVRFKYPWSTLNLCFWLPIVFKCSDEDTQMFGMAVGTLIHIRCTLLKIKTPIYLIFYFIYKNLTILSGVNTNFLNLKSILSWKRQVKEFVWSILDYQGLAHHSILFSYPLFIFCLNLGKK